MNQPGKGKANKISGIPLQGSLSQTDESSVEPNRKEQLNAFREDTRYEPYAHDYFRDESERLDKLGGSAPAAPDEHWSEGIADEANEFEEELEALHNQDESLQSELLEDFGSAITIGSIVDAEVEVPKSNLDDMLEPGEMTNEELMAEQESEAITIIEEQRAKDIGPHRGNQKGKPR
ncbi:MAG: hypothetical protein K2W82_09585 [Candidatus Obscuribacterales bacterium]|nr:hypothetical protein [Candidatus Obscuribacterales bacterium]